MKKGQVALEYILIVGAIIAITTPLFYYSISQSSENLRVNEVNDAVLSLSRKADSLYALGQGSRDYVWITIPSGVEYTQVTDKAILIHGSSFGDITISTKGNLTGTIPSQPGTYKMRVEVLGNQVYIGPINDTATPNIISTTPSGTIGTSGPLMTATTDEAATCRYDSSDVIYNSMTNSFVGNAISHSKQLSGLDEGAHIYYARCIDTAGNVMTNSAEISFTVSTDAVSPVVTSTNANPKKVTAGNTVCITGTATDNVGLSSVWARITTPLNSPFPSSVNYTLYDDGTGCDGAANDSVYGYDVIMQAVGNNSLVTIYAQDASGNIGYQDPFPNIRINVTAKPGEGPGQGFTYVVPDYASYYKTSSGIGYSSKDSQMSTFTNVLFDLSDDDKNTPPSNQRLYHTPVGDNYEGFVVQLNDSDSTYQIIAIRIKVVDADILPYPLRVYAYASDSDSILTTNYTLFNITQVAVAGVNRGHNEVIVTNTARAGSSPYVRLRIMADPSVDKKVVHISEADFGVS